MSRPLKRRRCSHDAAAEVSEAISARRKAVQRLLWILAEASDTELRVAAEAQDSAGCQSEQVPDASVYAAPAPSDSLVLPWDDEARPPSAPLRTTPRQPVAVSPAPRGSVPSERPQFVYDSVSPSPRDGRSAAWSQAMPAPLSAPCSTPPPPHFLPRGVPAAIPRFHGGTAAPPAQEAVWAPPAPCPAQPSPRSLADAAGHCDGGAATGVAREQPPESLAPPCGAPSGFACERDLESVPPGMFVRLRSGATAAPAQTEQQRKQAEALLYGQAAAPLPPEAPAAARPPAAGTGGFRAPRPRRSLGAVTPAAPLPPDDPPSAPQVHRGLDRPRSVAPPKLDFEQLPEPQAADAMPPSGAPLPAWRLDGSKQLECISQIRVEGARGSIDSQLVCAGCDPVIVALRTRRVVSVRGLRRDAGADAILTVNAAARAPDLTSVSLCPDASFVCIGTATGAVAVYGLRGTHLQVLDLPDGAQYVLSCACGSPGAVRSLATVRCPDVPSWFLYAGGSGGAARHIFPFSAPPSRLPGPAHAANHVEAANQTPARVWWLDVAADGSVFGAAETADGQSVLLVWEARAACAAPRLAMCLPASAGLRRFCALAGPPASYLHASADGSGVALHRAVDTAIQHWFPADSGSERSTGGVATFAATPCGRYLAMCCRNGEVKMCSLASGTLSAIIDSIGGAAPSPTRAAPASHTPNAQATAALCFHPQQHFLVVLWDDHIAAFHNH